MKNIEIFNGQFTIDDVMSNADKIYVFGDNSMKIGKDGQSIIRDLPNTLSIRIKKGPSLKPAAFYQQQDIEAYKKIILEDVSKIKAALLQDKKVVLTSVGYGNVERISDFGNSIKSYLDDYLKNNLQFDNLTGKKFTKLPSQGEIAAAKSINLDYFNYHDNQLSVVEMIIAQKKIAFSFDSNFTLEILSTNNFIKFVSSKSQDVLVCRINDYYSCSFIDSNIWSVLENCESNLYDSKKIQIQFEFICSVNPNGMIKFNNEIFGIQKRKKEELKVDENPKSLKKQIKVKTKKIIEKKDESPVIIKKESNPELVEPEITIKDLYQILKQIDSKLDFLISKDNLPEQKSIISNIVGFLRRPKI